jgi:hypothetical protein
MCRYGSTMSTCMSTGPCYVWRRNSTSVYIHVYEILDKYDPVRRKRLDVILKRPHDLSLFLEVVLDLLDCVFASVELEKSSVSWVTPMLCLFLFSVYSPFQHPTQHQSLSLQRRLRNGLGVPRHCLR